MCLLLIVFAWLLLALLVWLLLYHLSLLLLLALLVFAVRSWHRGRATLPEPRQ